MEALHLLHLALAADAGCDVAKRVKRDALLALDIMTGGQKLEERRWIASEIVVLNLANK